MYWSQIKKHCGSATLQPLRQAKHSFHYVYGHCASSTGNTGLDKHFKQHLLKPVSVFVVDQADEEIQWISVQTSIKIQEYFQIWNFLPFTTVQQHLCDVWLMISSVHGLLRHDFWCDPVVVRSNQTNAFTDRFVQYNMNLWCFALTTLSVSNFTPCKLIFRAWELIKSSLWVTQGM